MLVQCVYSSSQVILCVDLCNYVTSTEVNTQNIPPSQRPPLCHTFLITSPLLTPSPGNCYSVLHCCNFVILRILYKWVHAVWESEYIIEVHLFVHSSLL